MPQTKKQEIVYTVMMVCVMVYGMVCYNIALDVGGMQNFIFAAALSELPIMGVIGFLLDTFLVGPTALTNDEWEYLLAARDLDTFKARFAGTKYGPLLGHHEYSVLKEGFFHYRCDWCRKWLRFSTDPTLVMLCYVWLARCEVQDLDHIIEGVHYKLPPEDVQPLLVGFDEKD